MLKSEVKGSLKVKKFFSNSELKVKSYEIFRPYFDWTSSVNDGKFEREVCFAFKNKKQPLVRLAYSFFVVK